MEEMTDAGYERQEMDSRIQRLTDAELKTALKKRKLYLPEAEAMLIREAIRRGVISSETDLLSPDFTSPVTKFSFFPVPDSRFARDKIVRSLMRSIMIAAIIPVYQGIMKFTLDKYLEGSGLISLGLIWIALAWLIMEKQERKLIMPVFVLTLLSMIYAGRIMQSYTHLTWSDVLIPVILYLFIFYALLYAFNLLRK